MGLCTHGLIIDSKGFTRYSQYSILGKYKYHNEYNGKPSFIHVDNNLYLYWSPNDYWKVRIEKKLKNIMKSYY